MDREELGGRTEPHELPEAEHGEDVIALAADPAHTAATQWLERTLDDSANKRLAAPDAYMATDAILVLTANVASGLRVNEDVVAANLAPHLPFMAMEGAPAGGARADPAACARGGAAHGGGRRGRAVREGRGGTRSWG